MKTIVKLAFAGVVLAVLTGCTGRTYNQAKTCEYDYLLHPAISISKMVGGCGE